MTETALCRVTGCRDDDHPREAPRGRTMCPVCQAGLRRALETTPARYAALTASLAPGQGGPGAGGGRGSGTDAERDPLRYAVADLRAEIRTALDAWARMVTDERGATGPATATVPDVAPWLATHTDWLATTDAGPAAHAEIVPLTRRARALVDLPRDRTRFAVGPCPEESCAGTVVARIPRDPAETAAMSCHGCGITWETSQWLRAGARILTRRDGHPPGQHRPLEAPST